MKKKTANAMTAVLLVLFIVGAVGVLAWLTGGFRTQPTLFSLTVGGKVVDDGATGVKLDKTPLTFGVDYKLEPKPYTVTIAPNIQNKNDFEYTVDGEVVKFSSVHDYAQGFELTTTDTGFTLFARSLFNVLQSKHAGKTVRIRSNAVLLDCDYFTLIVTSGNSSVRVGLSLYIGVPVDNIELDQSEVIF